jgi:hemerythrin
MEEENLMDDMSYPSASGHKHLHDMFLADIDRVKTANKQCHISEVLNNFVNLRDSFIHHILAETQEISDYMNSRH